MTVPGVFALAGSVALASLVGSPHCAGMCGGFVCFFAGQDGAARPWTHAAYHLGRLVSYAALGALAGALGAGLDTLGAFAGLHRAATVAAGVLLLVWGGLTLVRPVHAVVPSFLRRALHAPMALVMRAVHPWSPPARALALGLVTTLLPCGWLWLYVTTAAGTGAPASGALVMAAFWLGTVPILAGLGIASQRALGPLRRRLPALTAAGLIVIGLLTITGKFHAPSAQGTDCPACRAERR